MKYRPHRGSLHDSMDEVIVLPDRAALLAYLTHDLGRWGYQLEARDLLIAPYSHDDRNGWNTHIVTIRNKEIRPGVWFFSPKVGPDYFGAIGFTDGPA